MKKSLLTILALCFLSFSACAQSTKTATLTCNVATKDLLELLSKGNIIIKADDYGGFEKVGTLGTRLPTDNSQIETDRWMVKQNGSI